MGNGTTAKDAPGGSSSSSAATNQDASNGLCITLQLDAGRSLSELTAAVNDACNQAEERADRSVVLLRLPGPSAETRSWPGKVDIQQVNRWERAVRRLERLPTLSIAVAAGACGGPALDLLLVSDYRVGASDLRLLAPVNDGHFWPGMAVYRISQQLGAARARQIVLWGDEIDVVRAQELGLIDQITDDADSAAHTATVLMGRISDRELAIRRQLLLEAQALEFDDALGAHLAACDRELRRLASVESDRTVGDVK
ncbi:enoyl-CoA-hydratase DpgB [Streptomyces flavidovirens]